MEILHYYTSTEFNDESKCLMIICYSFQYFYRGACIPLKSFDYIFIITYQMLNNSYFNKSPDKQLFSKM